MFNQSQYRMKNPKSIILDNVVYSHAGNRYIQGDNPTYINPETPPLGKYIIGSSIVLFNNENIFNLFFCVAALITFYVLSLQILKEALVSLIPVLLLSFEKLFQSQVLDTPLLDIIQLTFLFLAFIFLNIGLKKKNSLIPFSVASVFLGFFISTKFFATGVIVCLAFVLSVFIVKKNKIKNLLPAFLIVPIVLIISYFKLFTLGYSLREILGVQKWVFLYNSGHLDMPPFVVWDLLLFNRWHTWWADRQVISDSLWSMIWPIFTILTFITIVLYSRNFFKKKSLVIPSIAWVVLYSIFLSFGHATSRYLLILLPFLFLISVSGGVEFFLFMKKKKRFKIFITALFLLIFLMLPLRIIYSQEKSTYVLPYPGVMPGSKLYKINQILEEIEKYYYFGDFSSFKYNLNQSDKYLVEAKTLFEYNQYPLALRALKKSNKYFEKLWPILSAAKNKNKNIEEKSKTLDIASQKHVEVLTELKNKLPEIFIWMDEKKDPVKLLIWEEINNSVKMRLKNE